MTKLTDDQIVSAISGKSLADVKQSMCRHTEIFIATKKLLIIIGEKSVDDKDLRSNIGTLISVALHPFSIKVKFEIMNIVSSIVLTGKDDEIMDQIKKFKEEK